MTIYTVHEPPARLKATHRGAERFRFVRDGFYFWAFLTPLLWMLWHRLWLVLLGYLLFVGLLTFALIKLGVTAGPAIFINLLIAILIGLEASTLRRWTLARNKWRDLGVVSGDDLEAAEQRFFATWSADDIAPLAESPARPVYAANTPRRPQPQPDVVGLFPEPSAR
jgi:xanthosine utilization system XapX-like protein